MRHLAPFTASKELPALIKRESVFRLLLGDMQFEKHIEYPIAASSLTFNLTQ